jgi:RimJ/RimL family protein N-acetyltransferase
MKHDILREFPETIETERLILEFMHPRHADGVHEAIVDSWERLRKWMSWAASETPQSHEATVINVKEAHLQFLARKDLRITIFLKGTDVVIGGTGLHRFDWSVPRFEIGYWVRTGYEGQGYVTEAVQALTEFAFNEFGAKRVEIMCDAKNTRSAAVAERLGYELEGIHRCDERHHLTGELRDTMVWAKVRSD